MDKINYTYIVRCSDGTLYTGWTTDVERRVRTHNSGHGKEKKKKKKKKKKRKKERKKKKKKKKKKERKKEKKKKKKKKKKKTSVRRVPSLQRTMYV